MALRVDDVDLERDRALVQRFQAGDEEAFDELYRRYHDRLERFCRKRVGDQYTAEELTQEAFTRALTALPDLTGELRFYPWVSVIAARLCVDSYRRESRSEPASDPDPGPVAGGQEEIIDAVDGSLVATALSRLVPRHQEVLHLREVEGWSYQAIADHYGVKVSTVETLLFRARRALRREFHLIDGAGLLAWPVLGRLIQVTVRLRNRMPTWVPSLPSPTTVAAAASATAAAVVLAVAPGPPSGNPGSTPPGAQAQARASVGPTAAGASASATPVAITPAGSDSSATLAASSPAGAPAAAAAAAAATAGVSDMAPAAATVTLATSAGASPAGSPAAVTDPASGSPLAITSPLAVAPTDALASGAAGLPVPDLPGVALPGDLLPLAPLAIPAVPVPAPDVVAPPGPSLDAAQGVLKPVLGGLVPGH
ncbi:MAG: hypothetical protein QOG97_1477 [Acidimicrobiaceae bacterium]|nr:hypothetical protein [Acidimicrobiaceae bacterium]